MRRRAIGHRDENEAEIVAALRALGCKVLHCEPPLPDLCVGFQGVTHLMGVKAPDGPRGGTSKGRGRKNRPSDHRPADWPGGPWVIVTTISEAIAALGLAALQAEYAKGRP